MYLAYGWPQSIPLDPDDSDRVVLLRVLGRCLLAVCPASLHLWSATQHRVRLARFDRSPDSLAAHGQNAHAVWSPDAKTVAVLVSPLTLTLRLLQHALSAGTSSSSSCDFSCVLCADLVLLPPHIQGAVLG
jgi:RAB6A-GEF complex partner protein 1